ncbi:MAG: hypothetical protein PVF08_07255 [Gammaproteobacteria bacterium]|jgi:uncharacterized membrane protein
MSKHKKSKSILLGTLMLSVISTSVYAGAASNFAATIRQAPGEGIHLLHSGVAEAVVSGIPAEADNTDTVLSTGIKTANKKDLLIGVSLQNGIYTDTTVKGKNGSSEKAGAMAGIKVKVVVKNKYGVSVPVFPSEVVFASRVQELSAVMGGVIRSCEVSVEEELDEFGEPTGTSTGTIVIADDCIVDDEEIGLMLSTTSANHFNFVAPDMEPGDHTIDVVAMALSSAAFENGTYEVGDLDEPDCTAEGGTYDAGTGVCTFETTDNEAKAWALVDVGTLTVQQVRAINQDGGITTDLDTGACYDGSGNVVDCN